MNQETKQALKELRVILVIIFIFIFAATLIISIYSRVDIFNAFQTVFMHILSAGTGGVLGNIFYVIIVFLTLGVTFYMFEKVIMLLSEIKVGGILMKLKISSLKNHYIVCGAGRVGMHAAEKLKKAGKHVVVIDNDCPRVEFLRRRGYSVIEGDGINEDTLEKARIKTAKGIIACTSEDSKNVFLILTAKDLNPAIKIAARLNDQNAKAEFERAGADVIVAPEVAGGYELAEKIAKI